MSRRLYRGVLLAIAALVAWLYFGRRPAGSIAAAHVAGPAVPSNNRPPSAASAPPATDSRSELADTLNSPASDIRADLKVVSMIVDTFRTNFPHDGNPVGNNAEITTALTGRNKLRLSLIPPDHPAINRDGELCDRWGTPFFFHAESATRMGIRSAGPDRKMWTDDDVVLTP
jgi:hypothetical protein